MSPTAPPLPTTTSTDALKVAQTTAGVCDFYTSVMSESITNSKSKDCGPIKLYDINPTVSCCEGGVRVLVLSHFKLSDAVKARFIVADKDKNIQTITSDILKQPEQKDCHVFNQFVLQFDSPKQDMALLNQHIYSRGHQIRLSVVRTSDSRMSSTSFEFRYMPHGWNLNAPTIPRNPPASPAQAMVGAKLTLSAISKTNSDAANISGAVDVDCVVCDLLMMQKVKEALPNARPGIQRRIQSAYLTLDENTEEVKAPEPVRKAARLEINPAVSHPLPVVPLLTTGGGPVVPSVKPIPPGTLLFNPTAAKMTPNILSRNGPPGVGPQQQQHLLGGGGQQRLQLMQPRLAATTAAQPPRFMVRPSLLSVLAQTPASSVIEVNEDTIVVKKDPEDILAAGQMSKIRGGSTPTILAPPILKTEPLDMVQTIMVEGKETFQLNLPQQQYQSRQVVPAAATSSGSNSTLTIVSAAPSSSTNTPT